MRTRMKLMMAGSLLVTIAILIPVVVMPGESLQVTHQVLLVIAWMALIGLVYVGSLWLSRRWEMLAAESQAVAAQSGAGAKRVTVQGDDEAGLIASQLNRLADALSEGEMVRNRLVGDVAHELRTPLSVLRGQLELLLEGQGHFEPERLVPLLDEVSRMSRLIHDLQQLSLADANQLVLHREWIDLNALIFDLTGILQLEAEEKQITIAVDGVISQELYGDRSRLKQVLINLLGNAIRYARSGDRIAVVLTEDETKAQISVIDTGPGISPDHFPYLFQRFYRGEDSRNRKLGGTGLGLAIVKSYTEAHGGQVSVQSEPGKGTVFMIELPFFPIS